MADRYIYETRLELQHLARVIETTKNRVNGTDRIHSECTSQLPDNQITKFYRSYFFSRWRKERYDRLSTSAARVCTPLACRSAD